MAFPPDADATMTDETQTRWTSIGWQCALIANRLRNRLQIEQDHARDDQRAGRENKPREYPSDEVTVIEKKNGRL